MNKIGFACQIYDKSTKTQLNECKLGIMQEGQYLGKRTSKRTLPEIVSANLIALRNQILYVSRLPEQQRFFRMSSDILTLRDHPEFGDEAYSDPLFQSMIESSLKATGDIIKNNNIRTSMHPAQYTTLCSPREIVINKSIKTLECHKYILECMGLTPEEHGVVINIHTNGQKFDIPIDKIQHLKNWISFENDEKKAGHNKTLDICEKYGIRYVFDIHHYFCENGEYLDTESDDFKRILNTWGSQIPKFHLSQSRDQKNICAHSDIIDDPMVVAQAKKYLEFGDIMVEAKHKNLASSGLVARIQLGL